MPADRNTQRVHSTDSPRNTQLWKRKEYVRPVQETSVNSRQDRPSSKGKAAARNNLARSHGRADAGPGSSAWVVDLVRAALKADSSLFALQLALHTLSALERGNALWDEINALLAPGPPNGILAAVNMLSDRVEEAQKGLDGARSGLPFRQSEFQVTSRPFTHEDMEGRVCSAFTHYIKPPADWLPADPAGKPPTLDHAPTHCIFLVPKRPYNAEEPYHLWILDENHHWIATEPYAPHPNPKLHPRVLRLQPNGKMPNWVLPDTIRRKPPTKPKTVAMPPPDAAPSQAPLPSVLAPRTRRGRVAVQSPPPVAGPSRTR